MTILLDPNLLSDRLKVDKQILFELGFGNGDFLVHLAKESHGSLVLGAEIANKFFLHAFKKVQRLGLENVLIYRGDGRTLLNFFIPNERISSIYINFPDPWEKPSKEEKRLTSKKSLMLYYSRLRLGGSIYISTDSDVLKDYLRKVLEELKIDYRETSESPYKNFQTKYEKKWLSLNKPISYFIIKKLDNRTFCTLEECSFVMPNFVFELKDGIDDPKNLIEKILPLEIKDGNFFAKIERWFTYNNEVFLFRVIHSEPFLNQRYYFELTLKNGKGSMGVDDRDSTIITKFTVKIFRELAKRIFGVFGKKVIFENFGGV